MRCRFQVSFHCAFPSSLRTCLINFQVCKLGVNNEATKFACPFQCLNFYCSIFVVQVEINNSMDEWNVPCPVVSQECLYFIELLIIIELWTFVYKRSSNIEMYLRTSLRSSSPIFELGNAIGKFATNLGHARWKVTWNRQ